MQRLRQDRRLLRLRSSVWLERLQASNAAPLLSVHRCLHSSDAPASSPPPGSAAAAAASARPPSWVDSFAPASSRPFLRLARVEAPVGTALLLLPCYWSLAMAAPAGCLPDAKLLALFGAGAFLLRGFGCTVNDLWDVELDRKVARTRARPLPSGDVTFRAASAFALAQLTAGGVVWLQLPPLCQALSLSVLPVVAVYPLAKRFTFWPQAVLGIAFNWGIPTGFAAALGSLPLSQVAPLFVAGWGWTMVYDTLYAHQDKADDVAAGVKSTALRFGDNTPSWLAGACWDSARDHTSPPIFP